MRTPLGRRPVGEVYRGRRSAEVGRNHAAAQEWGEANRGAVDVTGRVGFRDVAVAGQELGGGPPFQEEWFDTTENRVIARIMGQGPRRYTRSDERIADEIADLLTDDPELDATGISFNVRDGEVTLEGEVESRVDRHRAEDLVERVGGVKHITNSIRVVHPAPRRAYEFGRWEDKPLLPHYTNIRW